MKKTIDTYYMDPLRKNLKLNADNKLMECFLEVEVLNDNLNIFVQAMKEQIYLFIHNLGLDVGSQLNSGKPELLLNKNK